MTTIPTNILLFELNRVVQKMEYSWIKSNSQMLNTLQQYATDLRNELARRKEETKV